MASFAMTKPQDALPDGFTLGESVVDSADSANRWFVLHTRSRQEKAVAEVLGAAGGTCFLPLQRRTTYYGHRRRVVEAPLFTCYVFLWGMLEHAYLAVSTKRAARVIPVVDQVRFGQEIAHVRLAVEAGAELGPHRFLRVGRHVRVRAGPFEGLEGIVESGLRQERLILQVQAIGRALSLEIDASLLELVD